MCKVWVAGSANVDLVATSQRFPRPGETLLGDAFEIFPGGKGANQAVAAAQLGSSCSLIARLGDDKFADFLHEFLVSKDVDVEHVRNTRNSVCGMALITVAQDENTIIVVSGANSLLSSADVTAVQFTSKDVLVAQLETPIETTTAFFQSGRAAGATSILNGAPAMEMGRRIFPYSDVIVLNVTELALFSGAAIDDDAEINDIVNAMRSLRGNDGQDIVVTLGANGVAGLKGDKVCHISGRRVNVRDTTGAGDCFVGALASRFAAGDEFSSALRYANTAASIAVTQPGAGTGMPRSDTVDRVLAES